MTGNETFRHSDLTLQLINNNKLPFGEVSVMTVRDLLLLPPVKQQGIYINPKKGSYDALHGSLWQRYFNLFELMEIVRQSSDPDFAKILSRVREGKKTDTDILEIEALALTDTTN